MGEHILFIPCLSTNSNIQNIILNLLQKLNLQPVLFGEYSNIAYYNEDIKKEIQAVKLIIADVSSDSNDFIMGQVAAYNKPVLFISSSRNNLNTKYSKYLVTIYNENRINEFINEFSDLISLTLTNIDNASNKTRLLENRKERKIFISYSHKDSDYLDKVLVHLKPLQRNGTIDIWVDTRIKTGDKWENEIEKALKEANAAILLISADYIASDFIINQELQPLLLNAQKNGTRILPVIIKPCRFLRDKSLNEFQAINDPKIPICSLEDNQKEQVYDNIAQSVEELFGEYA